MTHTQDGDQVCPKFDKLTSNAIELMHFGSKNTRTIVESLLSTSFNKEFLKQYLSSEWLKHVGTENEVDAKKKSVLGKVRYSTLRRTFTHLQQGRDVSKHDCSFRVDSNKIPFVIEFLKDSLCVKPWISGTMDFLVNCNDLNGASTSKNSKQKLWSLLGWR